MIYCPPEFPRASEPLIFLAGPIQGAPDWHSKAIGLLDGYPIASPKRPDDSWKFDFEAQVDWESKCLEQAARTGCILFWLAKEETHHPDRAYAQTTRFELAEWITRKRYRVVIGIEPGFSGERYIRHRMLDHSNWHIFGTLEETCQEAKIRFDLARKTPIWE